MVVAETRERWVVQWRESTNQLQFSPLYDTRADAERFAAAMRTTFPATTFEVRFRREEYSPWYQPAP